MPFCMWGGVGQSDHVLDPPGEGAILGAFLCLITVTERHHSVVLQIWPEQKLQSQKKLGRHGLPWPLIKSAYDRVVNIWNSLPNWVVSANTTNTFKARLDKFWHNQDVVYDFKAQLQGTGSCSECLYEES